jgi:hypothetical protein
MMEVSKLNQSDNNTVDAWLKRTLGCGKIIRHLVQLDFVISYVTNVFRN